MQHVRLLILIIGIFQSGLSFAQVETSTKFTGEAKMVVVEPTNIITTEKDGNYQLVPYRERRPSWGTVLSLSYSNFEPLEYEPNFLQVNFDEIYSRPEMPLLELQFAVKKNLSFGSLGGEISVGIYQNDSDEPTLVDSSLQLIPVKLGAVFYLDALRPEPFIVPYVSGGGYIMLYRETLNDSSFSGNTQVAPYFNAGLAFSLDWFDRHAARISYEQSGIEASYAYLEARTQFQAGDDKDPDFSSAVNFAGGLRVEF